MFRKKKMQQVERIPVDTIFIIGNGFDMWQGLRSSYSEFQKYYLEHREKILRKLHIKKHIFVDSDGENIECSDVELIYGDPFQPDELDNEFWNTFEASLDNLDAERLNLFFGKEKSGLKEMEKSIKNARRILSEAFCSWIATMNVDEKDSGYSFGENCVFINFNYTDTLIKRFGVNELKEYHIHGEATDKKSIIFGHSKHPQEPEYALARLGGRFLGLFFVDKILYETDKHCQDNIQTLCMFLAMNAVMSEEIKDVYVLGHSMGPADLEYFDFLVRSTQVVREQNECECEEDVSADLDELHNRLQYVIQKVGYGAEEIDDEYEGAVSRKFRQEQNARNDFFEKTFMKMLGKKAGKINSVEANPRTQDAKWHISYYSEKDKQWAEIVMKELGCDNYELYSSIDDCLKLFKKGC